MSDIIINNSTEILTLNNTVDEIVVFGDVSFALNDVSESINVSIVDESTSINISEVEEVLSVVNVEETYVIPTESDTLDFTSSEANIINNANYIIDTTASTGIAGGPVGAFKLVTSLLKRIYHADNTNELHEKQVLGLSLNSGNNDDIINIIIIGLVVNQYWNWIIDAPLFLSSNGDLTSVKPVTGFVLQIGHAISATEVWINIQSVHVTVTDFVSAAENNQLEIKSDNTLYIPTSDLLEYNSISPLIIYQSALVD